MIHITRKDYEKYKKEAVSEIRGHGGNKDLKDEDELKYVITRVAGCDINMEIIKEELVKSKYGIPIKLLKKVIKELIEENENNFSGGIEYKIVKDEEEK